MPLGAPEPDEPFDPVKPASLVKLYEQLFAHLRGQEFTLFELGIKRGDSLAMWTEAFPEATVIGLDLEPPDLDLGPRVRMWRGDQTDCELIGKIRASDAPGGFDVVIDDASHQGAESAASLRCIFNAHLRPGGTYVIEDWFTGYTDWWSDGRNPDRGAFEVGGVGRTSKSLGKGVKFPSHQFGLPGVVKQLIDQLAAPNVPWFAGGDRGEEMKVSSLRVESGAVILERGHDSNPQAEV